MDLQKSKRDGLLLPFVSFINNKQNYSSAPVQLINNQHCPLAFKNSEYAPPNASLVSGKDVEYLYKNTNNLDTAKAISKFDKPRLICLF